MAHVRTQIRDSAKTALTGLVLTGSRCYAERVYPIKDEHLPGIIIYTGRETRDVVSKLANGTLEMAVNMQLICEIYVKDTGAAAADADTIYSAMTEALFNDETLNGLVKQIEAGELDVTRSAAEKPVYVARVIYDVVYHIADNNAETAI